jgi:hypothetical protein
VTNFMASTRAGPPLRASFCAVFMLCLLVFLAIALSRASLHLMGEISTD